MSKKSLKKRISMLLAAAMATTLVPVNAFAAEGDVAKIGDVEYATLDEAVAAAVSGDTIELLADCTTNGWKLSKNLTIDGTGAETITFENGISLTSELTFSDCDIVMTDIVNNTNNENGWMDFCMSGNAKFNLNNVDMTMTGTPEVEDLDAAFYMCVPGNDITLTDSTLTIQNYKDNAFAVDTPVAHGYKLTMVNSELTSDGNRACFAAGDRLGRFGCMDVSLKDSILNAMNNTDDGCSGTQNFYIDNSKVTFTDNRSRGIRAYDMEIKNNSVVTISGKHSNFGLSIGPVLSNGGSFEMDGTSELYLTSNTGTGLVNRGVGHVADGAVVSITGNGNRGIMNYNQLIFDEGSDVTISKNTASSNGGGIYNSSKMSLPTNAELYNNHAKTSGDDIYNTGNSASIAFNDVTEEDGYVLDGVNGTAEHCTDAIDGWYDDSSVVKENPETGRWQAHADEAAGEVNHIIPFNEFDATGRTTFVGKKALKAAHGLAEVKVTADVTAWHNEITKYQDYKRDIADVYDRYAQKHMVPTFEKKMEGAYEGTLVTRLNYSDNTKKAKPINGGVFDNGHTYVKLDVAEASKEGGVWYTIADSSKNNGKKTPADYNRPIEYWYHVQIKDGKLTVSLPEDLAYASVGAMVFNDTPVWTKAPKHYANSVTIDMPSTKSSKGGKKGKNENNQTVYLYVHFEKLGWYDLDENGDYQYVFAGWEENKDLSFYGDYEYSGVWTGEYDISEVYEISNRVDDIYNGSLTLTVDGKEAALNAPLNLTPGEHTFTVTGEGFTETKTVTLKKGQNADISFVFEKRFDDVYINNGEVVQKIEENILDPIYHEDYIYLDNRYFDRDGNEVNEDEYKLGDVYFTESK